MARLGSRTSDWLSVLPTGPTWGRCYDHNFRRFSPIFGKNIGVFFLITNVTIQFLKNGGILNNKR
jgi:hypothetical protein